MATCSCMPNCFLFILWARLAGRSVQSYKKWSFFSVFSRLGRFHQVFRQVKKWPILELHETIRVSHAVACTIFFFLFIIKMGREECLVIKIDHFLVFLAVWILFPYVFGQLRELLILELNKMIRVVHVIAWSVDFDLLCDIGQHPGVLKMLLL